MASIVKYLAYNELDEFYPLDAVRQYIGTAHSTDGARKIIPCPKG